MSTRDSKTSLQNYLRRQYWIFALVLGLAFLSTSMLLSMRASLHQHRQECAKFAERLLDIKEVLVREAVLQSEATLDFELQKLGSEFQLSSLKFREGQFESRESGCRVSLDGYSSSTALDFGGTHLGIIEAQKSIDLFMQTDSASILLPTGFIFLICFALFYWMRRKFEKAIVLPILTFSEEMKDPENTSEIKIASEMSEYVTLQDATNLMFTRIRSSAERIRSLELSEELAKLSRQVAHDIRSPLSALAMMQSQLSQLPEDHRNLMKTAIQRINDIANDLLRKGRETPDRSAEQSRERSLSLVKEAPVRHFVPSLIDSIVSEKRIEYRSRFRLQIDVDVTESYGLFIAVDRKKLQRTLSNLINNSVEALPGSEGHIRVNVRSNGSFAVIAIEDNGTGITRDNLKRLGTYGFSHGKGGGVQGHGLGVQYALRTVEEAGGQLKIESKSAEDWGCDSCGTRVEIRIPLAEKPIWFQSDLTVVPGMRIVVVDDDQSIHEIWKTKFSNLSEVESIVHFSDIEAFKAWATSGQLFASDLLLIDFEFLKQRWNGIEIVQKLEIQKQTVLVTGRYDEPEIQDRCVELGLGMISKGQAALVPIRFATKRLRNSSDQPTPNRILT